MTTRPTATKDGTYILSPLSLKGAVSAITDFDNTTFGKPHRGNKKVLMVYTEERFMTMANGKKFSTRNHPVEMMVPAMHLKNAGFEIDVVTPTGKPVAVEMWAMPKPDKYNSAVHLEALSSYDDIHIFDFNLNLGN